MSCLTLSVQGPRPDVLPEGGCWEDLRHRAFNLNGDHFSEPCQDDATVTVQAVFYLPPLELTRTSVNALGERLLSTLFTVGTSAPAENGGLFPMNHHLVWHVVLDKRPAMSRSEEGVDVTVYWP